MIPALVNALDLAYEEWCKDETDEHACERLSLAVRALLEHYDRERRSKSMDRDEKWVALRDEDCSQWQVCSDDAVVATGIESEAAARLMAAAPLMLEALRDVVWWMQHETQLHVEVHAERLGMLQSIIDRATHTREIIFPPASPGSSPWERGDPKLDEEARRARDEARRADPSSSWPAPEDE